MVEAATVYVCPVVKQLGGDVHIADVTRPEERGPAVGVFSVDVGALLHQQRDAVCLRLSHGVVEGSAALCVLEVKLRAALDKCKSGLCLTEDTGVDQRRPAVLVSLVNTYIGIQ